jgi:hypothetical protein
MSQLSYWEIRWAIPSALVLAAADIGGGLVFDRVVRGLQVIRERGEEWMQLLAEELLSNPVKLQYFMEELKRGRATDKRILQEILDVVLQ